MDRRTLLGSVGTLATALAGCIGARGPVGGRTEPPTADPDDGSRFDGEPCPSFEDGADRTVCWHALDPADADLYLEPSTERFRPSTGDDSVETMSFVLHNDSGGAVGFNPYAWAIRRRTADGWAFVAPDAYPEPWLRLEDGLTYTWVLAVEEHPTPKVDRTRYPVVDLDDGVHAFEVTVAGESGPNAGERVECVALFEVRRA